MEFAKANVYGNDFILIKGKITESQIKQLADRRYGLGADQILTINENYVEIWNCDGSKANMCMNGLKAIGKWFNLPKMQLQLEKTAVTIYNIGELTSLELEIQPKITKEADHYLVDIGNLHKIFINSKEQFLQSNEFNITNLKLIKNDNKTEAWYAETIERGVGSVESCGSAAFAAAAVLDLLTISDLNIHYKTGIFFHSKNNGKIIQTAQVTIIATGIIHI